MASAKVTSPTQLPSFFFSESFYFYCLLLASTKKLGQTDPNSLLLASFEPLHSDYFPCTFQVPTVLLSSKTKNAAATEKFKISNIGGG
jgi:hypothetical protein